MAFYLSSFINRIDKKGRVSVPAPFRAVLAKEELPGVYAMPSLRFPCVQCCGLHYFDKMHEAVDGIGLFSDEREALAATIFGETSLLSLDSDGRIILPQHLLDYAHLREGILFVGKGETFELWDQEAYQDYRKAARAKVRALYESGEL